MKPRILLVNPPIFDFSAYDYWLKPYGMLRVAGWLAGEAEFCLFDFMDRLDARVPDGPYRADAWGRGEFYSEVVHKPPVFSRLPRRYRRFGLPRTEFRNFLASAQPFDYVFVQTVMTYWYPGVREVIEDLRAFMPRAEIILGGIYATVCNAHARALGADLVVDGLNLEPLWRCLGIEPDQQGLPLWNLYPRLGNGVLKLADGCPFRCTYCSVPYVYPRFAARPLEQCLREYDLLVQRGVQDIAFYDDALLFQKERIIVPFLEEVQRRQAPARFHTPNALNARFVTPKLARLMVASGFTSIYLGFESHAYDWQKKTGGKVYSHELARAVECFVDAGMSRNHIHAYLIVGHPGGGGQELEESMNFANRLGIRIMLSEFAPIPGTPDGELCRDVTELDEPLCHNKTAFTVRALGDFETQRLKTLARELNRRVSPPFRSSGVEGSVGRLRSNYD
jgi:hypothetical protein